MSIATWILVASLAGSALAAQAAADETLSPPVRGAWMLLDGADGRLGAPLGPEGETATSRAGTTARAARFAGGEIILHTSGPFAGKAFAVAACDRLYVQYGGASGWLGLPTSDAINTPDGQKQTFEGGVLRQYRAEGNCEAEGQGR